MSEVTKPLMTEEMGARVAQAIESITLIAGPQGPQGVKGEAGPGFATGGRKAKF